MILEKLINAGDKVRIATMSSKDVAVELEGICVETSVVEFQRKYRVHFSDGGEDMWLDNYAIRHMATMN